jgi:hypothetical protein
LSAVNGLKILARSIADAVAEGKGREIAPTVIGLQAQHPQPFR